MGYFRNLLISVFYKSIIIRCLAGSVFLLLFTFISCSKRTTHESPPAQNFPNDTAITLADIIDAEDYPEEDDVEEIDYSKLDQDSLEAAWRIEFEKDLATSCRFDDDTLSIYQVIDLTSEFTRLEGPYIGFAGIRSFNYAVFELLQRKASNDDLYQLTQSPNPVARSYAFWALTKRENINLYGLVIEHLDDTVIFESQFGCMVISNRVGDFYINTSTQETINGSDAYFSDYLIPTQSQLSKVEIEKIDSMLLSRKDTLLEYHHLLLDPGYYQQEDTIEFMTPIGESTF